MKDRKKLLIGILSTLICVMAVGYALLAQQLTINGSASIDSTWKVEITNITQKELVGGVTEKSKSYTATTANFSVGLTQPGDSITYDIEVTNSGTLDAVISNINVITDNNSAIIYTTSGLKSGDTIAKNGEKKYLTVKIEYDSNVTSQPLNNDNDITVQLDYQQNLGQFDPIVYNSYSIGDTVQFAGSNWKVIKNSTAEEDYVTLMKETVLTHNELGDYALSYYCTNVDIRQNDHNCSYAGEIRKLDTMAYYWSDTCHHDGYNYNNDIYGDVRYDNYDESGCDGHSDYNTSKIKEMLETRYLPTLGQTNLKEIDGYKIRIITLEELQQNLGLSTTMVASWYDYDSNNTPSWVYENYGDRSKNAYGYWTMSTSINDQSNWIVTNNYVWTNGGTLNFNNVGVRPVINLLKSSIE